MRFAATRLAEASDSLPDEIERASEASRESPRRQRVGAFEVFTT